ncbi:hypothetical protein B0H67DRAFT_670071 [Lasiosphaeris hirsuta]|uniref:Uncharacterized protein n=1 Tax=Lasiosphaeris hirsuta TaxID=260670 RepID=A0AA40A0W6_9PEZI|nr:hypothetical protein B0H67DRAFT_670071 [Lasiosphaeris hirsuta]
MGLVRAEFCRSNRKVPIGASNRVPTCWIFYSMLGGACKVLPIHGLGGPNGGHAVFRSPTRRRAPRRRFGRAVEAECLKFSPNHAVFLLSLFFILTSALDSFHQIKPITIMYNPLYPPRSVSSPLNHLTTPPVRSSATSTTLASRSNPTRSNTQPACSSQTLPSRNNGPHPTTRRKHPQPLTCPASVMAGEISRACCSGFWNLLRFQKVASGIQ